MPGDSVQLKSQAGEVIPPVWSLLASKADYLDSDAPWLSQTVLSIDSYEDSGLWTAIAVMERIAAAAMLAFCTPLLLIFAIVVILLSRRSPFIAHRRVGRNACELWVLKMRTMWGKETGTNKHSGFVEFIADEPAAQPKPARDARITSRFALFCRKHSIDELPQLWQVVCGEMSLVGPRPLTAGEIAMHYGSSAALLASKRPGLTGLWQVKGRSRLSYHQRRRLDIFMVQHWSLRLYVSILLVTLPRVLLGRDAW